VVGKWRIKSHPSGFQRDFKKKGQAMKAKKSTKRLGKAKKLEATKPLSKVSLSDISITKTIDKAS
jgi:hypothetical protein